MKVTMLIGAATLTAMTGWTAAVSADGCGSGCGGEMMKPASDVRVIAAGMQARGAKDIVDTAVGAGQFGTLVAAVQAAGLVDVLKGDGPFTVFAPTDEAFAKLPAGTVENLLKPENRETLKAILTYHVVPGKVEAATAVTLSGAVTVNGQRLDISAAGGAVQIDNATVVATDVMASNGVIHVIDTVMLPESKSILEVAGAAGSFSTLAAAIQAAGLVGVLEGEGPFTVFAPTDEAFANLPAGTVENLLKPENRDQLVQVLTYHVVPGRVYSDQVVKLSSAKTVQGQNVRFSVVGGSAKVDNATITGVDIDARNGVIHVIDSVILPK